jgi:hypothetical protein
MITQEELKRVLHYDPDTGVFTWLIRPDDGTQGTKAFNTKFAGKRAGTLCKTHGYRHISTSTVDGLIHREHRLAFLYMTGAWPSPDPDHKNGDKSDNSWNNLREATLSQNQMNTKVRVDNASGRKGVSFCNRTNKWVAQLIAGKTHYWLGRHSTIQDAIAARLAAEIKYHGEYVRQT